MPEGTQVQHWNKVRNAERADMSPQDMNRNLSPLQANNHLPATALLVDPNGGRTRYSAHSYVERNGQLSPASHTYGNEHKFVDRYMIEKEYQNIKSSNPNAPEKEVIQAAGAAARWKMTGDPGDAPQGLVQKVDIASRTPSCLNSAASIVANKSELAQARPAAPTGASQGHPNGQLKRPAVGTASRWARAGNTSSDPRSIVGAATPATSGGVRKSPTSGVTSTGPIGSSLPHTIKY
jgi:hypothetical protein